MEAKGKVVIVTGASSGIGEATAREFAKEGAKVVLAARRVDRLEALAKEIAAVGGGAEALVVQADLSKLEDIQSLITKTFLALHRISPYNECDGKYRRTISNQQFNALARPSCGSRRVCSLVLHHTSWSSG